MDSASNITICEINGELVNDATFQGDVYLNGQVENFPTICVTVDSLRRTATKCESAQSAFLEHDETFWQKLQSAWHGHGFTGVLNEICNETNEEIVPDMLKKSCKFLLVSFHWLNGMQFTIFPHLKLSNDNLIQTFSENGDWLESPIRYLAWHSKANKFAIALRDDTIRIHYSDSDTIPVLKHKLQRNITVLQWKPLSASTLAVGTQTAVLIWTIDPTSLSTRPSTGAVQILSYSGHSPVTSLSWSPHGFDELYTSSALNSAIVVWNVSKREPQVIQHITTCGGVSKLLFSPDGSKALATTPSSSFRIFETATWTNERWSKLAGRVQSACWNPTGTLLLFCMVGDPRVYSLSCTDCRTTETPVVGGSKNAVVVIDLTPEEEQEADSERNFIRSLCWDETGERLAVCFDSQDPRHHMIALYSVSPLPVFSVTFRGFIKGEETCFPAFVTFKPNFDKGACLTICYSDGRVTHVPLYFTHINRQADRRHVTSPLDRTSFAPSRSILNASQPLWTSPTDASVLTSP